MQESIWKPDVFTDPSETFAEHQGGSVGSRPLRFTAWKFSYSLTCKALKEPTWLPECKSLLAADILTVV